MVKTVDSVQEIFDQVFFLTDFDNENFNSVNAVLGEWTCKVQHK